MHPDALAVTWKLTVSLMLPLLMKAWLMFPVPPGMDEGVIVAGLAEAVQLNADPDTEDERVTTAVSPEHHFRLEWAGLKSTSGTGLTVRLPVACA